MISLDSLRPLNDESDNPDSSNESGETGPHTSRLDTAGTASIAVPATALTGSEATSTGATSSAGRPRYGAIALDDMLPPSQPFDADLVESLAPQSRLRTILEWLVVLVAAFALALLLRTFLVQAFSIKYTSMEPTLAQGDRILVYKLGYDLHDIRRGEIVVFNSPAGELPDVGDLIKRVIALPGETLEFTDGDIYIDGSRLSERYIEPGVMTVVRSSVPGCANPPEKDRCAVPEGKVFVLGDNRASSRDSRAFGPIDSGDVIGRAFLRVWPFTRFGFL